MELFFKRTFCKVNFPLAIDHTWYVPLSNFVTNYFNSIFEIKFAEKRSCKTSYFRNNNFQAKHFQNLIMRSSYLAYISYLEKIKVCRYLSF